MSSLRLLCAVLVVCCSTDAQTIRIGVLGLFHPNELVVSAPDAALDVTVEGKAIPRQSRPLRIVRSGTSLHLSSDSGDWSGRRVSVSSADGALLLAVPGKITRRYRGQLDIAAPARELHPVITMDLELAVASAVAAESTPGTPLEALKAQAVATRSFYVAGRTTHTDSDFCDTTHCQFLRQPPPPASAAMRATQATRGLVLTYRGAPFSALFMRSCGGHTSSLAGLDLPVSDYPYFSVDCPYCRAHPDTWRRELPVRLQEGERDRLAYARQYGWSALPSNNYRLHREGGRLVAEGSGSGHGLGLCQRGAAAMARAGKSFRDILSHYYPNADTASR